MALGQFGKIEQDESKDVQLTVAEPRKKLFNLPEGRSNIEINIYVSGLDDADEIVILNTIDKKDFKVYNITNQSDTEFPNTLVELEDISSYGEVYVYLRKIGGGVPVSTAVNVIAKLNDKLLLK